MSVRSNMLELAILAELETPLHGYELRKRLSRCLGPVRRLSFGSLYPALHRLADKGLIKVVEPRGTAGAESSRSRRQVVYQTTAAGSKFLRESLETADVDDDSLGLAMGLMSKATPAARLGLLVQRRSQVLARREASERAKQSSDFWIRSRGELDSVQAENELSWIDRLIQAGGRPEEDNQTEPTQQKATQRKPAQRIGN